MKKILFVLFLLSTAILVQAQNPIIIQGTTATANMAGLSTATTTDTLEIGPSSTYIKINGEWDWSIQIIPIQYGVLTSDSVYATVKLYVTNKDNDNEWSEPIAHVTDITAASSTPVIGHYYPYRDTIANTTVALTKGLVMTGTDFQFKRMQVEITRPQTTDSVGYRANYVFKLHQERSIP